MDYIINRQGEHRISHVHYENLTLNQPSPELFSLHLYCDNVKIDNMQFLSNTVLAAFFKNSIFGQIHMNDPALMGLLKMTDCEFDLMTLNYAKSQCSTFNNVKGGCLNLINRRGAGKTLLHYWAEIYKFNNCHFEKILLDGAYGVLWEFENTYIDVFEVKNGGNLSVPTVINSRIGELIIEGVSFTPPRDESGFVSFSQKSLTE